MPKHDYIFVDESGDPAYTVDPDSGRLLSTSFYVAAALHLCDDSIRGLNQHMAAFRYYSGLSRELKIPPEREVYTRLIDPIRALAEGGENIWASVVYVDKLKYNGSYLKPEGGSLPNPLRFRNYMLRRLLEHHFQRHRLQSNQYDLVLDRIDLSREQSEDLWQYISGNRNIPTPAYITHAASIYVEGLQAVHHIANGYSGIVHGGDVPPELSFVDARDISTEQQIVN